MKRRIAVIAPGATAGSSPGGRGHFGEKMARLLAQAGHDVTVFHGTILDSQIRTQDGITYVGVKAGNRFRLLKRFTLNRVRMTLSQVSFNLETRKAIKKRHAQDPFDIVHCTLNHATGFLNVLFPLAPTVLRCSSHMPTTNALKYRSRFDDRVTAWLESLSIRRARSVYMPSTKVAELYADALVGKHVQVVRTPYDPEFVRPRDDRQRERNRVFFFTAYLEELKGIYDLAAALPVLVERIPDIRMVIAGKSMTENGRDTAEEMCRLAGPAARHLEFVGFLDRSALQAQLRRAQVVALPSLFDNLPNALLEAAHMRSLIVATRGSSLDEVVVDGVNGFLSAARDPGDLAATIERALSAEDARRLRDAAAATVDELFSPEKFVDTFEAYLDEAIRLQTTDRA